MPLRPLQFHLRRLLAELALGRRWFRVVLHLLSMTLRPRHAAWHWRCICREF